MPSSIFFDRKTLRQWAKQLAERPPVRTLVPAVYRALGRNRIQMRGQGNVLAMAGAFVKGLRVDLEGEGNRLEIQPGAHVTKTLIRVRGNGHRLCIASGVRMNGGALWFEDHDCLIQIGRDSTFQDRVHLAVTEPGRKIAIGEDCMFAYDIDARTGDSHGIYSLESGMRINQAKDITIGNHVWVAAHVTILGGAKVKDGSIVGTACVLSRRVPANAIAIGAPAQIAMTGIRWSRSRD